MIPKDKKLHFFGGALVTGASLILGFQPEWAFIAAIVVGAGKEAYDATGRGNVEFLDFVATVVGGFAVYLLTFLN